MRMSLLSSLVAGLMLSAMLFAAEKSRDDLAERVVAAERAYAADKKDVDAKQALAEALYYLGTTGNGKAVKRAEALMTDVAEATPEAAQPKAYLGSIKLLRSSTTWAVWDKEKLARQGLEMLDEAVDAAPDDLEVRFVRAATTYRLPDWFERASQSREDFALIAEGAPAAVERGELEPHLAAAALFQHGQILEQGGKVAEAQRAYEQATQIDAESQPGQHAAAAVARLRD